MSTPIPPASALWVSNLNISVLRHSALLGALEAWHGPDTLAKAVSMDWSQLRAAGFAGPSATNTLKQLNQNSRERLVPATNMPARAGDSMSSHPSSSD